MISIRSLVQQALQIRDPYEKCAATQSIPADGIAFDVNSCFIEPTALPCRLDKPILVSPKDVLHRSINSNDGRATLIHALAHIEMNAIDLALDICWRFSNMPTTFYSDWLSVAKDESRHFLMLNDHLVRLGYTYGDFPAHNGLWDMAEKTKNDVLARLALVPRTLEARGLDASPMIRDKLASAGDSLGAMILDTILKDEIRHVAIGNHWYRWCCEQRGLDPISTYADLAHKYQAPKLRGPFNIEARRAAGFDDVELNALKS